ncbi:MAG: ribose 5-phosphate isomerase B [Armatimonadia bacterium]|nr:ribose 5-phosphate isomerase B [Armatimonadia bacterium]
MKIAIGNDHAGVELKNELVDFLRDIGHEVANFGVDTEDSMDYPDIAAEVARAVAAGDFDLGVIACGTGIGVSMAANKVDGVRAALCSFEYHARMAREHNDANICCVGARVLGPELARAIVETFVNTPFSGVNRHARRRDKIMALEGDSRGGQ